MFTEAVLPALATKAPVVAETTDTAATGESTEAVPQVSTVITPVGQVEFIEADFFKQASDRARQMFFIVGDCYLWTRVILIQVFTATSSFYSSASCK
jgi:hypothetical protein